MPLFFFDVIDDGLVVPDALGTVCPNPEAAKTEAAQALGEMARDALSSSDGGRNMSILVRDHESTPLVKVHLYYAVEPLV